MSKPVMEYWVMRVLMSSDVPPREIHYAELSPEDRATVMRCIDSGKLALLPNGAVVEPIEVFSDDEERAHAHREVMLRRYPGENFRVIMNADLAVKA